MSILKLAGRHKYLVVFSIAVIAVIAATVGPRLKSPAAANGQPILESVTLIKAGDHLQQQNVTLDTGTVESLNQADLSSQYNASAAAVNVALGDSVSAGQVLVALKNDDVMAQLEQAKAGLAAANAGLSQLKIGARPEDVNLSETSATQAKIGLVAAMRDAYAMSDDAVRNHVDKFFINPRGENAEFAITVNTGGTQASFGANNLDLKTRVEEQIFVIEAMLDNWQKSTSTLDSSADLDKELQTAKNNLQALTDFMNLMAPLVNDISTDSATFKPVIDGYKSEFSAARSTVSGSLSALLGAETNWRLAGRTYLLKIAPPTQEQLQLQTAQVAQAAAAVSALEAQVEKTYLRSPISGRVSYINARIGELIAPGTLVATVVNPGALQVRTYASENDLPAIATGDEAVIGGGAKGHVLRVSPAIDPVSKKAEIVVILDNGANLPLVGQTVTVGITSKKAAGTEPVYLLPIQAVKSNSESFVYSLDANNAVIAIPVKTGALIGENIEVTGSLLPDTKLIASVMGLIPGQIVSPQN